MSETIPRWDLPAIEFVGTDASSIEAEILDTYQSITGRSLAPGDPVRLFLLSIASIIIQQRISINTAGQQNLLSYAQGEYLDALGTYLAVSRLPASAAITTIRFTLSELLENNYIIPAGYEVTNGVVTFATDDELIIPAGSLVGEVGATCTTTGTVGNGFVAGQIATIVEPMAFIAAAQNITTTEGGADIEGDASFAERIRLAPNSFSVAGPKDAYVFHALSVSPDIMDVAVTSPTPGDVNVYVLKTDGELPGADLLQEVADYLSSDDIRPLTDNVTVLAPETANYSITVHYWINNSDKTRGATIQSEVQAAVEKYRLWQQGKIGRDITPGQLIAYVMNAGAGRIDASTFSPANYQQLQADEVAQCTNVEVVFEGYKDI